MNFVDFNATFDAWFVQLMRQPLRRFEWGQAAELPISADELLHWLTRHQTNADHTPLVQVLVSDEHTPLGCVMLHNLDWHNASVRLRCVVDEVPQRVEFIQATLDHAANVAFTQLNLHRVQFTASEQLDDYCAAASAAGFHLDARRRQALFYAGQHHDELIWSVLRDGGHRT